MTTATMMVPILKRGWRRRRHHRYTSVRITVWCSCRYYAHTLVHSFIHSLMIQAKKNHHQLVVVCCSCCCCCYIAYTSFLKSFWPSKNVCHCSRNLPIPFWPTMELLPQFMLPASQPSCSSSPLPSSWRIHLALKWQGVQCTFSVYVLEGFCHFPHGGDLLFVASLFSSLLASSGSCCVDRNIVRFAWFLLLLLQFLCVFKYQPLMQLSSAPLLQKWEFFFKTGPHFVLWFFCLCCVFRIVYGCSWMHLHFFVSFLSSI